MRGRGGLAESTCEQGGARGAGGGIGCNNVWRDISMIADRDLVLQGKQGKDNLAIIERVFSSDHSVYRSYEMWKFAGGS